MVAVPFQYQQRKTPITQVVPIIRLTPGFSFGDFQRRAALLFQRTLCYYSLIYYTGDTRAKEPPVIGVLVVCPGSAYQDIFYDLRGSGLLPYSKRWKAVKAWLEGYEANLPETPRELELEQQDLARIHGRAHLLDLSLVKVTFDHPAFAAQNTYKEQTMSKNIAPSLHEQIEKHKHTMDQEDILFYAALVEEKLEETRQKDMLTLLAAYVLNSSNGNEDQRKRAQRLLSAVELVLEL
jgi:hypothetical protein